MNNLNQYIIEKLKLNKDIKVSSPIEVLCKYSDTNFSKEEFDQIIDVAENLPIVPDYIYNGINEKKYNRVKYILNLVYEANPDNNEDRYRNYNIIRIRKDGKEKNDFVKVKENFIVRFLRMDHSETDFYPTDENEYYHSIEEVFDGIKKGWEDLNFEKSIEKYK